MTDKTLEEKREEMTGFLLENIVGKDIKREGNDIIFTDSKGKQYFIKTLSKQADFPYDFETNPHNFDEDRRRLKTLYDSVVSFIEEKNNAGFIPGFVFLEADTDFSQLTNRTKRIVNRGDFLKQALRSDRNEKAFYNKKELDPLEVVVRQFYKNNSENSGKKIFNRGNDYHPELVYFNPKKEIIEIAYFADVKDPSKFKLDCCPACKNPNGKYDHEQCKKTPEYTTYRIERDIARYQKFYMAALKRVAVESRYHTKTKGIGFTKAVLDCGKLALPEKELYIAVVKR